MVDPKAVKEARKELGSHLAAARRQAGLTQAQVADAILYSRSTIANVETGQQKINRKFWLRCDELFRTGGSLAAEHDRVVDLQNKHHQQRFIAAFGEEDHPVVWRAWLHQAVIGRPIPAGDPPPVSALEEALRVGNQAYQAACYSQLVRLPKIIGFSELLVSAPASSDLQRIARVVANAYLLASKLAAKLNAADIAWTAADRAASFSLITGEPALIAMASYQTACALAKQKDKVAEAEEVAAVAADRIASHRQSRTAASTSARGALLLHAAIAAARQEHRREAERYLQRAADAADQLGRDANEMWTAFGPANVRLHEISVAVALQNPNEALDRADHLDTSKLPPALISRRAQVHLDLCAAHIQATDSDPQALLHLLEYERIAPEAISLNATAGRLAKTLLDRERLNQMPGLRALAARAGVTR